MQRTKLFIQYLEIDFIISVVILKNGSFEQKNRITYYGDNKNNKNRAYNKKYRSKNKDKENERSWLYYIKNKEQTLKKQQEYRDKNKVKIKRSSHLYYLKNKESIYKKTRKWAKRNKNKRAKYDAIYREFGFDPINDHFEGSNFHHTHENDNHDIGIFIPADLHRSIGHNNKNQESMDKINLAAYKWLESNI